MLVPEPPKPVSLPGVVNADSHQRAAHDGLSIPASFRAVCTAALVVAVSAALFPTLVYAASHPDFSFFRTYLSDIGDTEGWSQVLFNSITLIGAPLRVFVVVLLALRLRQLGGQPRLLTSLVVVGSVSAVGTVLMTAVPFSVAPAVHKTGIPLYFFGVVILQLLVAVQELRLERVPRILPALCLTVVAVFLVFFALFLMLEAGLVARDTPVIWEWLCLVSSIAWLAGHLVVLGDPSERLLSRAR